MINILLKTIFQSFVLNYLSITVFFAVFHIMSLYSLTFRYMASFYYPLYKFLSLFKNVRICYRNLNNLKNIFRCSCYNNSDILNNFYCFLLILILYNFVFYFRFYFLAFVSFILRHYVAEIERVNQTSIHSYCPKAKCLFFKQSLYCFTHVERSI